jgi:hypothetical protein
MVTHPRRNPAEKDWLQRRISSGDAVFIPDVADYEVRRELLRAEKMTGVDRLDALGATLGVIATTPETLREAASLWAAARRRGLPAADDAALDVDVIIAAQAKRLEREVDKVIVATTNVGHLARFVDARRWEAIA